MSLNFIDSCVVETSATSDKFWNSIKIWNDRPNLVNKRLVGVETITKFVLTNLKLIDELVEYLLKVVCNKTFVATAAYVNELLQSSYKESIDLNCVDSASSVIVYLKKMLPKKLNPEKQFFEISILDCISNFSTFWNIEYGVHRDSSSSNIRDLSINGYRLKFMTEQENLKSYIALAFLQHEDIFNRVRGLANSTFDDHQRSSTNEWLKNKLLPKIVKWSKQDVVSSNNNDDSAVTGSLKLIDVNEYCALYQKLKDVYGKKFVKIWPESTDPLKFVYEDVAIAAYLLLLWKDKKQKFVDLGCGNGLLVHILTCEGHSGLGIDVRSRKIWELYPENTAKLEVKTISPTPDDSNLFPDVDWLIGNHSDELTPWIPVIASLSNYNCNFFLLPCCAYELDGQKYQRQNSSKSQYMDYIDYIGSFCDFCGFVYKFDKLRIPSTKRICIVSNGRNYNENQLEHKVNVVKQLVNSKCCSNINDTVAFDKFKARSSDIKVRNCTQLDRNLVRDLVLLISEKILNSRSNDSRMNNSLWNEGNPIRLNELARDIPKDYLKQLKKECGGLQTLIKNHHYIFKIDKGAVSFRKPLRLKDIQDKVGSNHKSNNRNRINQSRSFKTKQCWFYNNHPDKCPLTDDDCIYLHL